MSDMEKGAMFWRGYAEQTVKENDALRAEVEKLKTDLATEVRFRETAQRDMKSMLAENEKLRAALRAITECHMYSTRPWDIARAALEKSADE